LVSCSAIASDGGSYIFLLSCRRMGCCTRLVELPIMLLPRFFIYTHALCCWLCNSLHSSKLFVLIFQYSWMYRLSITKVMMVPRLICGHVGWFSLSSWRGTFRSKIQTSCLFTRRWISLLLFCQNYVNIFAIAKY
jgi:hypothetical protein